jgi:RNA polymerase sigma factor for flagellar operon FliA
MMATKLSKEEIRKVWIEYKKTGNRELRNILIEQYLPIVRYLAERLAERLPPRVQVEDLISTGIFGLIDAIERFDINRGIYFEHFCRPRIQGAMVDELRATDWVPRVARSKASQLEETYIRLENKLGRAPTDIELANELKLTLDELDGLMMELQAINLTVHQRRTLEKDDSIIRDMDDLEDKQIRSAFSDVEKKDLLEYVKRFLTAKERYVLMMYYFENLTFKEIGVILNLSESRVCQLHARLLLKLRAELRKRKEGTVE